jgi:paraquat-inducible protein A
VLASRPSAPEGVALQLACTAAVAYIVANLMPMMSLSVVGRSATTTIVGGAVKMWMEGQRATAVLVAFCSVVAPGMYLLFMLTLLVAVRRTPPPAWVGEMLRWIGQLQVWSMGEVMMLGVLVALVKIAQLSSVTPGIGMYAYGALILLMPAIMTAFDRRAAWARIAWVVDEGQPRAVALREQPP